MITWKLYSPALKFTTASGTKRRPMEIEGKEERGGATRALHIQAFSPHTTSYLSLIYTQYQPSPVIRVTHLCQHYHCRLRGVSQNLQNRVTGQTGVHCRKGAKGSTPAPEQRHSTLINTNYTTPPSGHLTSLKCQIQFKKANHLSSEASGNHFSRLNPTELSGRERRRAGAISLAG